MTEHITNLEDCPECRMQNCVVKSSTGRRTCGACSFEWTAAQWKAAHRETAPLAQKFVSDRLQAWEVKWDYSTEGLYLCSRAVRGLPKGDEVALELWKWEAVSDALYTAGDPWKIPRDRIDAALRLWKTEQDERFLLPLRSWARKPVPGARLKRARYELRRWICHACRPGSRALSYFVMMHWIWGVKRKLAGYKMEHHIFPVLIGAQGGGKTEAVKKFVAPLNDLVGTPNLSDLGDERTYFQFERDFISVIEELAKAGKTDMENVKKLITSDEIQYRNLGHNTRTRARQNSSFIGTSNIGIKYVLKDSTGMRRFWELRCKNRLDWDLQNILDYKLIWDSADANEPPPLRGRALLRVRGAQNEQLRIQGPEEEFLEDWEHDEGAEISSEDMWELLAAHMRKDPADYDLQYKHMGALGRAAKTLFGPGFRVKRRRVDGARARYWPLRKISEIMESSIEAESEPEAVTGERYK